MDAMASPSRVKIDRQGRLVLPQHIRDRLLDVPGELLIEDTVDGVILRPINGRTRVVEGEDGLPVLEVGRPVANDEVLDAIDAERDRR